MKNPLIIPLLCITAFGCKENIDVRPFEHPECNSIYYWRTDFRLDSIERDFITNNDIGRMYIRFFDVVAEDNYLSGPVGAQYGILPNATITFTDPVPSSVKHVVPTIYITIDALKAMKDNEADAASRIVRRTLNMVSYNEVPNVSEIQLDCDWTESTGSIYFNLCQAVRDTLNNLTDSSFVLSSTIRLHQLRKAAPPVDYGVLMCYNTGSFRNPDCRNSILDYDDVEPYFKSTVSYPLHLDLALPIYDWILCYQNNRFAGIMPGESKKRRGDVLRHETSDYHTIQKVKELIDSRLVHKPQSVILYHLDSKNIKNYTSDEISQIYTRDNN